MVSVEDSVIARLTKGGKKFEIIVDPEAAMKVKSGKDVPIENLVAAQGVYEDSKKGLKAADNDVNKAFGTNDMKIIAYKIVRDGEVQLTTEQRNKLVEDKRKAVAALISKMGINPQTNAPHPQERVLRAMEQARARIDAGKSAEEQAEDVIKAIRPIIPISFEKVTIAIKIDAQHSARGSGIVREFGKPSKEQWASDGSYLCTIEVGAAAQSDLFNKLNALTRGEVQIKILKKGE